MIKRKISIKEENLNSFPLLALPEFVASPMIPQPIKLDNENDIKRIENILSTKSPVVVATLETGENSEDNRILPLANLCVLDRILQMPGTPTLALIRSTSVVRIKDVDFSGEYPVATVSKLKPVLPPKRLTAEHKYLIERIEELFKALSMFMGEPERESAKKLVEENSDTKVIYLYAISHVTPLSWEEKYRILECKSFVNLLDTIAFLLDTTEQRITLQASIHQRTHQELSEQQKEVFLRAHLKQIREELGESDEFSDIEELQEKAKHKKWNEKIEKHFTKELQKLQRLNINNPEYSVQYAYLENFLELPWENYKDAEVDIRNVKSVLDRDHFGLEKVKERILEYMAVMKLRKDLKAPILCLYGPPGVGKTSIGKSVAEAVNREYARISLGGVHDEAEIRGHRRTYIGAMPGRFLHSLSKLEYGNPLILLDEIDKVGQDYKGDPASALLEALDPEQNNTFHDNFIDYPYDLSKVLFIATANDLSTIPAPLRDRMEIIEMPKYTHEEKREIALRHLVDKALVENGFESKELEFPSETIDLIIRRFTKEKGVRQLKMQIAKIIRKIALMKVRGEEYPTTITPETVTRILDTKDFSHPRLGFYA